MDTVYSGLRRTRKRAHSSKCPCCYSSDEDEENNATTKKEKIKEDTQGNGKQTNRKKQKQASDNDDRVKEVASKPVDSVSEHRKGKKPEKTLLPEKQKKSGVKRGSPTSKHDFDKDTQDNKNPGSLNSKKHNIKPGQASSKSKNKQKSKEDPENTTTRLVVHHAKPKKSKNVKTEFKSANRDESKIEDESRDSNSKNKKNSSIKVLPSPKVKANRKQNSQLSGKKGSFEKGEALIDNKNLSANKDLNSKKLNKESKGKSSKPKGISGRLSPELSREKGESHPKRQKVSSSGSNAAEKRKIEVFDHLFSELKKCPGFRKITVSSGAEILLKLTTEKLKDILPSSKMSKTNAAQIKTYDEKLLSSSSSNNETSCNLSESTRMHTEGEELLLPASDKSSTSCDLQDLTVAGRGEEAKLSQAAEALVSFRAGIPLAPDRDTSNSNSEMVFSSSHSVPEFIRHTVVSTKEAVSQTFDSFYVNTSTQNKFVVSAPQLTPLLQGMLQSSVGFSPNIEPNLAQGSSSQQEKVMPHENLAPAFPSVLSPIATETRTESLPKPVMSSIMMNPLGAQNLPTLFCQPTQPSNIQTSLAAQMPVLPLGSSSTNPQLRPQQPLKGMEDVVSCVGSQTVNSLLWNIKPAPVVYLTSPQMLSGVRARNLIPQSEGHVPLPFSVDAPKVQSVGPTKTSLTSTSSNMLTLGRVTVGNQTAPINNVNASGQRPILPRELRMPSLLPSMPQAASQLPVSTLIGPVHHSSPPVQVGGMSLQFNSLGGTTSHGTGQPLGSTIVSQALMTPAAVTSITQSPVTQAPFMQVGCNPTGQVPVVSSTAVSPVSAKQAVKRFVRERTKSAELRQTNNMNNIATQESGISISGVEMPDASGAPAPVTQVAQPLAPTQKMANPSTEFNLQQAASALLSIGTQDALETTTIAGDVEDSQDDHDDEVMLTKKGVFRVGDVDVDPKYNRIGREGFRCGKCGKIFTSLNYLARHVKRVCPDMSCRKWKCNMCDKAFRHPFGLQQHIYTHTGERPHKCLQCPKAFYSSNDLRRHSRIHSGERPYQCKHCDKSFATTISLKTHTYIHTGEKPHKCPHCPKTFATSSKLGRHIVTHSEQRPFTCDHCPKSFNRSGDLRRHNMHVHECHEKPFDFEDSDMPPSAGIHLSGDSTKEQDSTIEHVLQCLICGEQLKTSSDLRNHLLSHDAVQSSTAKQGNANQARQTLDENVE